MRNILITGASSPSGLAAIERFSNNNKVFCFTHRSNLPETHKSNVITHKIDFSLTPEQFSSQVQLLQLPKIDLLIHCAAITPKSASSNSQFYLGNVLNPISFFEHLEFANQSEIINFSSSSVYKKNLQRVTESSPIDFSNQYGVSKYFFERYLIEKNRILKSQQSINCTVLNARIPVLIVKGKTPNFIGQWQTKLENSITPEIFGPDEFFNSCVSIYDIFHLFEKLKTEQQGKCITTNVGVSNRVKLKKFYEIVSAQLGYKSEPKVSKANSIGQYYDCSYVEGLGFKFQTIEQAIQIL